MSFLTWFNNADMPEKTQDGKWIDLETGISYDECANCNAVTSLKARKTLSTKALDSRAVAKIFGGKALSGTAKQKNWAEKIRAEKLVLMTKEQAELVCDKSGLLNNAKFWIEHREKGANEIIDFVIEQKRLLKLAKKLHSENRAEEYAKIASSYNELTEKWGFK